MATSKKDAPPAGKALKPKGTSKDAKPAAASAPAKPKKAKGK